MNKPKLYVLDTGRMMWDKGFMVSMYNPASVLNPNPCAEYVEFPVYAVLIDHPEGKILFDTGCNPEGMGKSGRWPTGIQELFPYMGNEECYLINRLEQLGVLPGEIKYVVASHLHLDHAGCLEFFKNATVIVHDMELTNAMKLYATSKNRNMGAYIWADIDAWIRQGLIWRTIGPNEDEITLAEGVKILNFGSGHTFGLLGLHVELPGTGGIILASDAVFSSENYGPPVRLPGGDNIYDSLGYVRTVEKIKQYAARTNSIVWFGHDTEQFKKLIKSTEGYYE